MTKSDDTAQDALARIVRLVSVRDRAVQEMRERLRKEGFSESSIEEALERAVNCGILDDQRFADSYIKGKMRSGWGEQRITRELRRLGIMLDDIDGLSSEHFNQDDQVQRAVQALAKHRSSAKNQHQAKYCYLISKGYSSSVVQTAINQCDSFL